MAKQLCGMIRKGKRSHLQDVGSQKSSGCESGTQHSEEGDQSKWAFVVFFS